MLLSDLGKILTEMRLPLPLPSDICSFHNLKVKVALLDELMLNPDHSNIKDRVVHHETKSLRDTRGRRVKAMSCLCPGSDSHKLLRWDPPDIIANVNIQEACAFIEDNPHPRLWRILAESALERLNFSMAEIAFVRCQDYQGIQFVKRLKIYEVCRVLLGADVQ